MANDFEAISVIAVIIAGRIWSAIEHRKTGKQVNRIEISLNGELEKRLKAEYQRGIEEGKNMK